MARPKKPRYFNGVRLKDNLYPDPGGREGYWRYRRPDGRGDRIFPRETVEKANEAAEYFNAQAAAEGLDKPEPGRPARGSWPDLVARFIAERETEDPSLAGKQNWINMRTYLGKFGREFADTTPGRTERPELLAWWKKLSHHQQNKRHTELRRLFNWAMGENYCPRLKYNPFTTNDDRPRFYLKAKPEKARSALSLPEFWSTHDRAGDAGMLGLQRAMMISLVTTMRQGDICKLRFDQVVDGELRVVIGKSEAQRGAASATRLAWALDAIPLLRDVINDAQCDSLKARRCPFVVCHVPERNRKAPPTKEHPYQMLPGLLQKQFKRVRPEVPNPPTFHEIRALSSVIYRQCGHDIETIQQLMAHTDESTTLSYQDRGDLPYKKITLGLTAEDIGRKF
jgi:integrase